MKKAFTLGCIILSLPLFSAAQPVVTKGEFYYIGNVIQMANCDATGITAGAADSAGTWDFTGLSQTGALITTTYTDDTAAAYPTSTMLATVSNGMKRHEQESSSDTYILGTENTLSGEKKDYLRYNISKRPMTYNSTYLDTFYMTAPATGAFGRGYMSVRGDAWGTLKLPTGTYENVLRIRRYLTEGDTLGTSPILSSTTITYLWFDTVHHAPLLKMDSVMSTAGFENTIMYLANPTAVGHISAAQQSFSAFLNNSDLTVTGGFEAGNVYEVTMYNIIGSEIVKQDFSTTGNSYRIDANRQLSPGVYIVSIAQKNDPSTKSVIKVFKQ